MQQSFNICQKYLRNKSEQTFVYLISIQRKQFRFISKILLCLSLVMIQKLGLFVIYMLLNVLRSTFQFFISVLRSGYQLVRVSQLMVNWYFNQKISLLCFSNNLLAKIHSLKKPLLIHIGILSTQDAAMFFKYLFFADYEKIIIETIIQTLCHEPWTNLFVSEK